MCEPPMIPPSDCPAKLTRAGFTPTGPAGSGVPGAIASVWIDFVSVIRSASPCRRLSRVVAGLGMLTKCVPEASITPSDTAAPAALYQVDVERALRCADALRLGRIAIQRVGRIGDAVQRKVDCRDDEARIGEAVRHSERVRTVTRDAVLHDRDRPAAGRRRGGVHIRAGRGRVRNRDQQRYGDVGDLAGAGLNIVRLRLDASSPSAGFGAAAAVQNVDRIVLSLLFAAGAR